MPDDDTVPELEQYGSERAFGCVFLLLTASALLNAVLVTGVICHWLWS